MAERYHARNVLPHSRGASTGDDRLVVHLRPLLVLALGGTIILVAGCSTTVAADGDGNDDDGAGGDAATTTVTHGATAATGSTTTTSTSTGAAGPLDCGAHLRCAGYQGDGSSRSCGGEGECIDVPGCVTAICIEREEVCAAICGSSSCDILESDPEQVECAASAGEAVDDVTCDDVMAELETIQSCTADDECGQVIDGFSCGCTRDLVARLDAPLDIFLTLADEATDCDFGSTCDCPETDGFACVDGTCAWRYVDR